MEAVGLMQAVQCIANSIASASTHTSHELALHSRDHHVAPTQLWVSNLFAALTVAPLCTVRTIA
jgi:hypothetical protein